MAFRDLFKKKVGGGFLGNMIRNVGDSFTGGMVSKLLPVPDAQDVLAQEMKWASKGKEFTPAENLQMMKSNLSDSSITKNGDSDTPTTGKKFGWKVWAGIAAGGSALIGIIVAIVRSRSNGGRRKRR